MTLHNIASSTEIVSVEHRENYHEVFSMIGKNMIRQSLNRTVVYSDDLTDGWCESYVDVDGRAASVTVSVNDYTGYDPATNSYFAGDFSGGSSNSGNTTSQNSTDGTCYLTITNTGSVAKRLESVRYQRSSPGGTVTVTLLNGATTSSEELYSFTGGTASGVNTVDVSDAGICIMPSESITMKVVDNGSDTYIQTGGMGASSLNDTTVDDTSGSSTTIAYDSAAFVPFVFIDDAGPDNSNPGQVVHTIPTGTFNSAISSSFGTTVFTNWESGLTVDYKLTNASDDSGWLDINEVSEFTAFSTGEPTTLTVRLTPKASTPTALTPSISGFWVRAV